MPLGTFNSANWTISGGTQTPDYIYQKDFDVAMKSISTATDWSVSMARNSFNLANGKTILGRLRLNTSTAQGEVGLLSQSGKFFGIRMKQDGGQFVARLLTDTGGGLTEGQDLLSSGQFALDKWYRVAFTIDSQNGCLVRIWQETDPQNYAEVKVDGFSAEQWKYRQRVNTGTLWFDAYTEGTLFSESYTNYYKDTQYDAISGGNTADILLSGDSAGLSGKYDLSVNWVRPYESVQRTYDGNSSWYGTRTEYEYNTSDQGGTQYGNLTSALTQEWDGSDWVDHHRVRTEFFPNVSSTKYLAGLPARVTTEDSLNGGAVISEALNIYDTNSTYNSTPTTGQVKKTRTLLADNQYGETGYGYDAYGNITSVTQYTDYGTASSSPATGAQTTNTAYDDTYHTYATSQTNTLNQVTYTGYDYNLGVPTSVTDANNVTIYAAYDLFGRMTKVAAPEDTLQCTHPHDCL